MKLEEAIKSDKFKSERHKAVVNILYTAYWLRDNFTVTLKDHGITLEQFNVMRILKGKHPEPMRVKDIGSRILEKSSNVPRIIDRLVAKKLAKRAPSKDDKRETLVSITNEGITLLEQAVNAVDNVRHETVGMDQEQSKMLNELLEIMRNPDPLTSPKDL